MFVEAKLMTESGNVGDSVTFTAGLGEIESRIRDWALPHLKEYPWDSADVSIWPNQETANTGIAAYINYRLLF